MILFLKYTFTDLKYTTSSHSIQISALLFYNIALKLTNATLFLILNLISHLPVLFFTLRLRLPQITLSEMTEMFFLCGKLLLTLHLLDHV